MKTTSQGLFFNACFRGYLWRVFINNLWDIIGLLQGSKRPLPRKLRKMSENGFPGPLGPGIKNAQKESKITIFQVFFGSLALFRLFSSVFDPKAERPQEPLFRPSSEFSRKRPFRPLYKANDVPKYHRNRENYRPN